MSAEGERVYFLAVVIVARILSVRGARFNNSRHARSLTTHGWLCVTLIGLLVGALATEIATSDVLMLVSVVIVAAFQVVSVQRAFAGFSNPSLLAIGALLAVSSALNESGVIARGALTLLGSPRSLPIALLRSMSPVVALSAFLNNAPVVAMFIPALHLLSRRTGLAAGKLFMPLSFAAVFGGELTLIGCAPNLLVAGMVRDSLRVVGDDTFAVGFFEVGILGLPREF